MLNSNVLNQINAGQLLVEMASKNIPIKDALLVHNTLRTGLCKAGDLEKVQAVIVSVGYEPLPV